MIPLAHDILCYFLCHGFSSVLLHLTQISQQTPICLSAAWLLFLLRSMPPGWLQIFNYPQTCRVQTGAWRTYNTEDKGSVTKPFSEQKSLHTFLRYKISHSEISLEPDVHSRKHMARGRRFIFLKSSWKVIVSQPKFCWNSCLLSQKPFPSKKKKKHISVFIACESLPHPLISNGLQRKQLRIWLTVNKVCMKLEWMQHVWRISEWVFVLEKQRQWSNKSQPLCVP